MKRANAISGIILCVFSLVMLAFVIPGQISTGPSGMMSPRLVPQMTMIGIFGLSVLLVLGSLRGGEDDHPPPFSRKELLALLRISAVFAIAIALYENFGALIGASSLVIFGLLALGERRPLVILALTVVLLTGLWALFYKVLGTAIL